MGTCGSIPKVKEGIPHNNIINDKSEEGKESNNIINGKGEEGKESNNIINGKGEEKKESNNIINGKGEEGKENKNIINGKGEEGKENKNIINGKGEEEKENKNTITSKGEEKNGSNNIIIQYRDKVLRKHNDYRVNHNSPILKMNEELNKMAEKYAIQLLNSQGKEAFPLNIYNNDSTLGENIMISTKKTAEEICETWYNESKNYDYSLNKYQKGTGHFTQIIWKETKEVGFGFKFRDNNFCVVAYYYPAGNILGEFSENICRCK